jgi:hypothetical protein
VDQNLAGVLETIDAALQAKQGPHPVAFGDHPPPKGRAIAYGR